MERFVVRPITFLEARKLCEQHPYARTLPLSSKWYMALQINGKLGGLAVWGWGVRPKQTVERLFGGVLGIDEYAELCRFFVYGGLPKNTASRFLSITHRLIKKYAPQVKVLYTYAAGFQGLIGTIYQAANYDYIGKKECNAFFYLPGKGLLHSVSLWHHFRERLGSQSLTELSRAIPGLKKWHGYNFAYLYWLCGQEEKERLLKSASFQLLPYPGKTELEIWVTDARGDKESVSVEVARKVPIIHLPIMGTLKRREKLKGERRDGAGWCLAVDTDPKTSAQCEDS